MFLFSFIVALKSPVVLLPPFFGTNLWATYNNSNLPWYCPKSENDKLIWISSSYMLPFKMNCLFKLASTFIDENGNITNWPNTTIHIHDFGGDESTRYVVHADFINKKFAPLLTNFIDHYTRLGYVMKKDLFVAPYDWRLAPTFSDDFWPEFKNLIEKAYETNEKEKITIIGFSLGGYMVHHFLTNHCTQSWKDKYISQTILVAPSFMGNVQMLYNIWVKRIPFASFIKSEPLDYCIENMPSVHSHIANEVVYKDFVAAVGPDGKEYKAGDLYGLLNDHLFTNNDTRRMFDRTQEIRKVAPKEIGVKTTILFNSGRKTAVLVKVLGEGDGTMPAYGYRWVCKHFSNVTCIDFRSDSESYDHYPLMTNDRTADIATNITLYNKIPDLEKHEKYFKINDEL